MIPFVASAIEENPALYVIIPVAVYVILFIIGIIKQIITTIVMTLLFALIVGGFVISNNIQNDNCLKKGECKAGITVPTQYGNIKINQENCLKYKWAWNEEDKSCKVSINVFE